jgi:outer membrane receptor protein involved in Fe transport
MPRLRVVPAALSLLALGVLCRAIPVSAAQPRFAGRPVAEGLQALQSDRVRFVFSSQVLPAGLTVEAEPAASASVLDTARALLAPHGLELRAVDPGVWAVVRSAAPSRSPAPPQPADAVPLAELVISASRHGLGDLATGPSLVLAGDALGEQPGLGNDPLRAIDRLPGIATNGLSTRSNVRGGDDSETLLLLDGFPLRQPYHLAGYQSLFSVLDAGLVRSAEVFTGGFPVRYGNRMSAVFDLVTIDAGSEPRHSLGVDFFNASLRAGSRLEDLGADWLASARIGTLKPVLAAFEPDAGKPTYGDVFLKAGVGDEDTLRLTGNLLWSRDELSISNEHRGEQAQIEGRVRYAWLQARRRWTPTFDSTLWLGQTRIESLRRGVALQPGVVDASVDDLRAARLTDLRGLLRWEPATRHFVEAGFEYVDESADYRYAAQARYSDDVAELFERPVSLTNRASVAPSRERGAVFAAHRWQLTDSLTTEIGWRVQRLVTRDEFGDWINDPRLGLRWQLAPHTRLRLNWGHVHQVAEINELQIEDGRLQFGGAQRAAQSIIALEHDWSERVSVRLELYDKRQSAPRLRFENLLNTQTILPEVAPDRFAVQPDLARLRGAELSVQYVLPRVAVWGSVTWSEAVDLLPGRHEARSWDQPWALSVGGRWRHGSWRHSASLDIHRGWPTTPLLIGADGAPTLGARNSARFPLFAQLDLRTEYTLQLPRGHLVLTGELMNAQVRANSCCAELRILPQSGGEGRLATRQLYWLPIIPSLGVRWEF